MSFGFSLESSFDQTESLVYLLVKRIYFDHFLWKILPTFSHLSAWSYNIFVNLTFLSPCLSWAGKRFVHEAWLLKFTFSGNKTFLRVSNVVFGSKYLNIDLFPVASLRPSWPLRFKVVELCKKFALIVLLNPKFFSEWLCFHSRIINLTV